MNTEIPRRPGELRTLLTELARDFAPWPVPGARVVDEIECVVSVLLAIALAHRLGVSNVGWAASSAYIVLRGSFAESLRRGGLRVCGTAAGVALAWLLAPELLRSTIVLSAALALVGAVTLYLALLDRRGYGWLLVGLSFAMVLVDGAEQVNVAPAAFAQARFVDVLIGAGASILVSAASALTLRRHLPTCAASPAQEARPPVFPFWHQAALRHALQGAIALALIPWVWRGFHIKALSQSSVTIMAVMMVPLAELVRPQHPASTRLRHRFVGGGIGGLLATGLLMLGHASAGLMMLAVGLGVVVGRHIENGKLGISYVGTQFSLAFLVVLVPDCHAGLNVEPGLGRLVGILVGMALLEPVRLLFSPHFK